VRQEASSSSENIAKVGGIIAFFAWRVASRKETALPSLLSCEALVEEDEDFRDIELDVLEIKVFLVVLLHLEQIVELEIQLQQSSVATFVVQRNDKSAGKWACEVEVDVCSSVLRYVALLDHSFLLKLLVRKLVGSQDLVLLLLSRLALGLAAHIVQI
jgi:hypothetical protein